MKKIEDLLINKGLYTSITVDINDLEEMSTFLLEYKNPTHNIDCFCVKCNEKRIFHPILNGQYGYNEIWKNIINTNYSFGNESQLTDEEKFNWFSNKCFKLTFYCARNYEHYTWFSLLIQNDAITKIGQYPSYADLAVDDRSKYKPVLKEQFAEYNKAIGLYSHDIGIGAFTYLRRIIEKLRAC